MHFHFVSFNMALLLRKKKSTYQIDHLVQSEIKFNKAIHFPHIRRAFAFELALPRTWAHSFI